ncbi:MAG: hypothetical protein HOY78_42595 [Saccharothrix sp.]|nr:hypothetical protein [Saccharothrix sp.]
MAVPLAVELERLDRPLHNRLPFIHNLLRISSIAEGRPQPSADVSRIISSVRRPVDQAGNTLGSPPFRRLGSHHNTLSTGPADIETLTEPTDFDHRDRQPLWKV